MKSRQKIRTGIILISFFLFPLTFYYLSPVLILQSSAHGIINGSFIMFLLMFISALFLGRGYCGWVCPGAGCQEAIISARDKRVKKGDSIKWVLWIPWIGAIAFLAIKTGGYQKIDFLYQTKYGISLSDLNSLMAYYIVLLLLIVLPSFIFGKRSFCHHLCWMAPFMILGRKIRNIFQWPSLQLSAIPDNCTHCHTCNQTCPMSLPVEGMIHKDKLENSECILCGSCIDACKFDVIKYSFFRRKNPALRKSPS